LTCSENSTNDYQNERICTFDVQFTRMFVYECSTEDMLGFIDYRHISKQTETLLFNLHTKNTGFIVSQNLFSYFPKLQKICLLHADLKLDGDNIVWPKSLNKLSIYNSTQASIPKITGNHFTELIIDGWPRLTNISTISVFQDLEELTLKLTSLASLPAKIFMQNGKLRRISIWGNEKLSELHSDTLFGLKNLASFSLRKNPINSLPPGFFGNAPALKTISWEEDKCKMKNRTMPNGMLEGVDNLTTFNYSQHHLHFCHLIIEKFAFLDAYHTMQELKISNTELGSEKLIEQLARHFTNLTKLSLENNEIQAVNPEIFPPNILQLKIGHNPFVCNCASISALKILMKKVHDTDIEYVKLSNCPNSDIPLIFSDAQTKLGDCSTAVTGVYIGVIVAIIFIIILGCFIYHARVWLYSNRVFSYFYPGGPEFIEFDNEEPLYDVFITYAEPDRQIMEKLYLELNEGSKGRSFKCAVHEKDFVAGQSIENNMRNLITRSRRTIALVSKHYLNSQFCINELEMAMSSHGGKRLLTVVLDFASFNLYMKTNSTLRSYFQAYTYLDFDNGSPTFYKRLMFALPHKKMEVRRRRSESGDHMISAI